ncbi:MAG: hypothetical protein WBL33_19135, partial [Candidatus Acidiferrales bacterium]
MKRSARQSRPTTHVFWMSCCFVIFLSAVLVGNVLAQAPPQQQAQPANATAAPAEPNYTLAARFVPSEVSKLVFDTDVTPHWFELSDRFWYSYETPEGVHYWVVDPLRRLKT